MHLDVRAFNLALARVKMNTVDLAKVSGVSASTICKAINSGTNLRTGTLGRLAKALGVDPSEIVDTRCIQ